MSVKRLADIDPFDPAVIEEPHEFFAALRREAPLYELPNGAYYLISRFDDVQWATLRPDIFSSNLVAVLTNETGDGSQTRMVELGGSDAQASDVLAIADPPQHTRQRRVSNRAFTMRRVAAMEDDIRSVADSLVDEFIDRDRADWVRELAIPLPMTIITRLLGFPEQDIPYLKTLSDASVALLSGVNTADELARHSARVTELFDYLARAFDEAAARPADNVLGSLVRASQAEEQGFSRDEVVSILVQLLTAGNETTASLIGSAMMMMLRDEALQQELRTHPERIDAFVEEALRLESPFHGHFRVTKRDTVVGGSPLPAGSRVMLLWGSANRDDSAFDTPAAVDLKRPNLKQHLAFGYGIHHCIGAALARLEARVALECILRRTRHLRAAADNDFRHIPSLFIRSLRALHIEFDASA